EQVWRIPPDGGVPEVVAQDVHQPVAVRFDRGGVGTLPARFGVWGRARFGVWGRARFGVWGRACFGVAPR
ncbi:hypothetical protein, partial [Streptomyces sparsogenes]|uniref:hypothetical protein n=1 Tax=Streptomyces sparsogenes TaxID=67365 RepID=UPI0033DC175D